MSDPIYALDLDEDLLSHLPDPDAWVVLTGEGVTSDLIEDEFVAQVFNWQRHHLREHGRPATASVLEDQFADEGLQLLPPETAIGDLLDRLRDRYARNQGRETLRDIVKFQQENPSDLSQLLMRKGRELHEKLGRKGEVFGTGDYDRARRRYDLKVQAGPGASFGFPELDEYFFGMRGLTFWVAPPKTFKSWIMIKGAFENAMQGRCTWLYSLELPAEETDMRIRCALANVPWWHYIRNCITPEEWKRIKEASDLIDGCGIYKVKKPGEGQRGIDEMVYTARDAGADAIFFDQLQYIEDGKGQNLGYLNNTGAYWGVLNRARDLSDDGPLCIAHQFNRSAMYCDKMPQVEQAKGSSALEETATLALGMWANKDMRRSGRVEVGTLIARNAMYAAWDMEVELTHGCNFSIIGMVEDDEDD